MSEEKTLTGQAKIRSARERARLAKANLDKDRAATEKLIEDAATLFYASTDLRAAAQAKVGEHEQSMGRAIVTLTDNGQSVERIATLCGIDAREVRRLRKQVPHTSTATNEPQSTGPDAVPGDHAHDLASAS